MSALDLAWAFIKSDDFYDEFEDHDEFKPSITDELQARKRKDLHQLLSQFPHASKDAFQRRPIDIFRERQPMGNREDYIRFLTSYYMNPPATEQRRIGVQEIMDDRDSYQSEDDEQF